MNSKIEHLITAFVDNEIFDAEQKSEVNRLVQSDKSLAFELKVQLMMKNIVRTKGRVVSIPEKNKNRIIKALRAEDKPSLKPIIFFENLFSRPAFSYGFAVVLLLLLFYWVFMPVQSPVDYSIIAAKQEGEFNLFVRANNNFNSIIEGKLSPQIVSNNPVELNNFFEEQGVKYSTFIPLFNEWDLLGAVVSEEKGEKFAHHVYASEEGKIVYVYQVDKYSIVDDKVLTLTDEIIDILDKYGCFTYTNNNVTTIITKFEENICAVVSNENISLLEAYFCTSISI